MSPTSSQKDSSVIQNNELLWYFITKSFMQYFFKRLKIRHIKIWNYYHYQISNLEETLPKRYLRRMINKANFNKLIYCIVRGNTTQQCSW